MHAEKGGFNFTWVMSRDGVYIHIIYIYMLRGLGLGLYKA